MQKQSVFNIIIIGVLALVGFNSVKPEICDTPIAAYKSEASKIDKVKEEFSKIESKDDKILIYKQFAGASDFLFSAKKLTHTGQFDPILGRVQSSYGWDREKYQDFTSAVSEYLIEAGYDNPKKLESKEDLESFRKIFQELSEATKYE